MDTISPERRSQNMSRIRSKDTSPEMVVRRMAHNLGYRFRLHRRDLPGKPDLVFPSLHKAVFVHGCFWHQHSRCIDGRVPRSNVGYWQSKLERNRARDIRARRALRRLGWDVLVIWECETKDAERIRRRLTAFLNTSEKRGLVRSVVRTRQSLQSRGTGGRFDAHGQRIRSS